MKNNKLIITGFLLGVCGVSQATDIEHKKITPNKDTTHYPDIYKSHSLNCIFHSGEKYNFPIGNVPHNHLDTNKYKNYQIPKASRSTLWTPYLH